jgi:uncharacterized membrane protein YphA (DoxX/SURF4 family)
MTTVALLVALRLALGCHFLYEGMWKIKHANEFTAEPFLTQAKGPLANVFYAMIPDIDGQQRLGTELQVDKDKQGKVVAVKCETLTARWDDLRQQVVDYYRPDDAGAQQAQKICDRFCKGAQEYLNDNLKEIGVYLEALERFQNSPERSQGAEFQKKRRWDRMQELRHEAAGWIKELEAREETYKAALHEAFDEQQFEYSSSPIQWNPLHWTRMQQINFAVTYGLTAIGACLMLGFCTRLAALGGAGFMCFIVTSQWAFPGTYPPDPPMVGHALLINKDFIEMLALLTLATTAVGRWAGLDFFIYHCWNRSCRRENSR